MSPLVSLTRSLIERVRVLDPHHPLYGRTFCVIRRLVQRGGNYPASYEVEYYNGASLLIPVSATEHNVIMLITAEN